MTLSPSVEDVARTDAVLSAIDVRLGGKPALAGFALRTSEVLHRPKLEHRFIDDCRRSVARLTVKMSGAGLIAVTSPSTGEGRSTVAAAIATALARDTGELVCLLDLDFERASQAARFGVGLGPGLSEWLAGDQDLRLVPDAGRGLWLLPAGVGGGETGRLFHQLEVSRLLQVLRQRFSWVVADLPPILLAPHAGLVLKAADACVLAARYRGTTMTSLRQAAEALPPALPSGVILNDNRSRIPGWLDRLI